MPRVQVLADARAERALLPADSLAARSVRRVGTRIAAAAADGYGGGFQRHMAGLQWEFAVINSQQANAFVVPGGKVVVYTGELVAKPGWGRQIGGRRGTSGRRPSGGGALGVFISQACS
jgi:hypothetical protein